MDKIAILVPCYNESATVKKVVEEWKSILPEAVVYVYDNNSTDGTDEIAQAAGAVVKYEHQQGKGNVVRRMFLDIDAECYIMVDGDDTYPVEDGPAMAEKVLYGGVDMVVGDRLSSTYFEENRRPFHNFGNTLVRGAINRMFGNDIRDIMTGYRAMSYRFVKSFPVVSEGFEIETEMTIHAIDKNMYVDNHVVTYRDRPEGSQSKLNAFSDGIKVINKIFHLYCDYRPMQFFGILSALLLVLASILFIPVFSEYIKTGLVPRVPTLLTSGFIAIAALLSFFAGLILRTIKNNERREFEFKLQAIGNWYKQNTNKGVKHSEEQNILCN